MSVAGLGMTRGVSIPGGGYPRGEGLSNQRELRGIPVGG